MNAVAAHWLRLRHGWPVRWAHHPLCARHAHETWRIGRLQLCRGLRCGVLDHGFLRVVCEHCHAERLVAFSCKKRGFCPSCGARRMAESARHPSTGSGQAWWRRCFARAQ